MSTLAVNKHALHDFEILEKIEAGLVLTGAEVKSVRAGNVKLQGAYVTITRGGLWLIGMHIGRYAPAGPSGSPDLARSRQLLVHKREIASLIGKKEQKGLTIVPLELYTRGVKIKILLGIARGKKLHDKRATIKKRELDRTARALMKQSSH